MIPQKKINNEFWLVKKTRSPSQWQLSGSCLPMLCSDVYIFLNERQRHEKRMKYEPKMKTCNWNQPIRKFVNYDLSSFEFLGSVGAKIRNYNVNVLLA